MPTIYADNWPTNTGAPLRAFRQSGASYCSLLAQHVLNTLRGRVY
jgi:hypothetical protein